MSEQRHRYTVQQTVPALGEQGQALLQAAHVLVVGAGGLGAALLPLLVGAGVGHVVLLDPDVVEVSNLHRQTLYRQTDIGQLKVLAAQRTLHGLNPDVRVTAHPIALTPACAAAFVQAAHIVVDAADSFAVTYTLSDHCQAIGRPLVSGSALGLRGYAGVFCDSVPSYRAVFPSLPIQAGSSAAAGVLGPVVAAIGSIMAHCVMALIVPVSHRVRGQLVSWDAHQMAFSQFDFCHATEPQAAHARAPFVSVSQLAQSDVVIDLRAEHEQPPLAWSGVRRTSLDQLAEELRHIAKESRLVFCCRSGIRAARAAHYAATEGFTNLALMAVEPPRAMAQPAE